MSGDIGFGFLGWCTAPRAECVLSALSRDSWWLQMYFCDKTRFIMTFENIQFECASAWINGKGNGDMNPAFRVRRWSDTRE